MYIYKKNICSVGGWKMTKCKKSNVLGKETTKRLAINQSYKNAKALVEEYESRLLYAGENDIEYVRSELELYKNMLGDIEKEMKKYRIDDGYISFIKSLV